MKCKGEVSMLRAQAALGNEASQGGDFLSTSHKMAASLRVKRAKGLRLAGGLLVLITILHVYEQWRHKGPKDKIVVVTFKGRLGNQLFQVAASEYFRQVANRHGDARVVYKRNRYSAETDLSGSLFRTLPHYDTIDEACQGVLERQRTAINEVRHSCDLVKAENLQGPCTVVDGFFQCPAYAEAGREKVMQLLRAMPEYAEATQKFKKLLSQVNGHPTVALHVRRGDYTKRFNRGLLEPLPMGYYVAAKQVMPSDSVFLIFSDDLKWCRTELPGALEVAEDRMLFVKEKNNVIALILMMLVDHNIIANSTFSWWAAFLNENKEKKVCAPKEWFGPRVTKNNLIYPDTWIKL